MKKIIYWSPYLGHIGTKKSTLNSARGISFYGRNKFDVKLINAVGEWNSTKDIKIINFFWVFELFYKFVFSGDSRF